MSTEGVLTITPGGPDPTLSLGAPSGEEGRIGNPSYNSGVGRIANPSYSGIVSVPVLLDNPHPEGSTGMTEAILALKYDPEVLTVAPAEFTLGSIPALASGWQLVSVVDPTGIGTCVVEVILLHNTRNDSLKSSAKSVRDRRRDLAPKNQFPVDEAEISKTLGGISWDGSRS